MLLFLKDESSLIESLFKHVLFKYISPYDGSSKPEIKFRRVLLPLPEVLLMQ